MRGSPLLRFFLLALALAATAAGVARVTSSRPAGAPVAIVPVEIATLAKNAVPFRLTLSAPASQVELDTGTLIQPELTASPITGVLSLDPENPHVSLVVRWKTPAAAGEHRFAKLTLEAPGQSTFTHVFDADGDIDDLLELPLPAAK